MNAEMVGNSDSDCHLSGHTRLDGVGSDNGMGTDKMTGGGQDKHWQPKEIAFSPGQRRRDERGIRHR